MKKLIILFFACLTGLYVNAQRQKELTDFNAFTQVSNKTAHEASQNKNYALAVATIDDWFAKYELLSPGTKTDVKNYIPGQYYNLACYQALNGEKEKAITSFQKAANTGYSNYAGTIADTDLDGLRKDQQFITVLQKMREKSDYGYVLQNSGPYNLKNNNLPAFTYQSASAPELIALKNKFNLDSVSGNGDEISKLKNLLYWAHNSVRHDGNSNNPPSRNAIDLIAVCQKENRGVNCRMLSTILRDAYQAEGFDTRIVTCMPKDTADFDCHVITVVWSKTLNKWLWMDPTFNAYVSDDKGNLLNIEEVRKRLISGSPLVLNNDANWNNKSKETKEHYLGYYMSKNLYWLKCSVKSEWDIETAKKDKPPVAYINLYPGNFTTIDKTGKAQSSINQIATNNPNYFWQKPIENN